MLLGFHGAAQRPSTENVTSGSVSSAALYLSRNLPVPCRFGRHLLLKVCHRSAKGPAWKRMTLLLNGVNETASTANWLPFNVSQPGTGGDRRIHSHVEINTKGIPKALAAAMAGISGVFGMTPENSRCVSSSA